jgi:putative oxidoreductase
VIDETPSIDERKLIIPALAGLYKSLAPFSYALLRVTLGLLMFLPSGIDKMFHGGAARIAAGSIKALGYFKPEMTWAWTVAGLEFFGAILLALGLFTRPVAFAFVIELLVIAFGIMFPRGAFWTSGGGEVALLMACAALGFVFAGGGRYSLDRVIGREF